MLRKLGVGNYAWHGWLDLILVLSLFFSPFVLPRIGDDSMYELTKRDLGTFVHALETWMFIAEKNW